MKEEFVLVAAACEHQTFRCIVLSDEKRPTIICTLPKRSKSKFHVAVGQILRVDTEDLKKDGGTADILEEISDPKELRQLRKCGLIPAEDAMPQLSSNKPAHALAAASVSTAQRRVGSHAHDRCVPGDDDVAQRNTTSDQPQQQKKDEKPCNNEEEGEEAGGEEEGEERVRLTKSEKRKIREEMKRQVEEKKKMAPNLEANDDDADMDLDDL